MDQKPPSPLQQGVPVALGRTVFTEETENPAHLIARRRTQKMELKREHDKEYPEEQHREPGKEKELKKKEQTQQMKKLQRLHLSGPRPIYMIPTGAKNSMNPWKI